MRASLALLILLAAAPAHTADRAAFEEQMTAGMTAMMQDMHAPGYSGDADVDFLAMMTAHHRGAVEMARLVLLHGHDPLTRRLAEEIIAGQTAEIAAMVGRLDVLRSGPAAEADPTTALGGHRGAATAARAPAGLRSGHGDH